MNVNSKYVISLDNVLDINYLPLKTCFDANNFDTVPIWSLANGNSSDEFYEFELTAEEDKPVCEENSTTDHCYICDILVPTAFIQNHYMSEKHQICATIVRHALRRVTKHSQSVPSTHTERVNKSKDESYFCDHCSIGVNLKNKDAHEKTKEHQISVTHDRLLNGLFITYLDKSKVVASSRYDTKVFDSTDDSNKVDDDIVNTPVEDPIIADNEFSTNEDNQSNIKEDSDEEWIIFKDDNIKKYDDTIAEYSKNKTDVMYNEQSIIEINKNPFEIVTIEDVTVTVPTNNYHGIVSKVVLWTEDGCFDCLVCDQTFYDPEVHKVEPQHIEFISNSVLDINGLRQITDVWHHCIICNQKLQNKQKHVSSTLHKKNHQILTMSREQISLQENVESMYHCDKYNSNMHVTKKIIAKDNLHYHLKKIGDETLCILCNIIINDDYIKMHIKSSSHKLAFHKLLVTNKITKTRRGFKCHACNSKQKDMFEIDHVQSEIHKNKLSIYKPVPSLPLDINSIEDIECLDNATTLLLYLFEATDKVNKIRCTVCKLDLRSKPARIKKHLRKGIHQFNLQALLDVNEIKNRNGKYFCELCRSTVDFTKEIVHINSDNHESNRKNFPLSWRERDDETFSEPSSKDNATTKVNVSDHCTAEKLNTESTEMDTKTYEHETILSVCESYVPVNLNSIEDIHLLDVATAQLLYLFETSDKLGQVKCKVCSFGIKSKAAQINGHLRKQSHNFKLQVLMDVNRIKNKFDGTYFCEVCHSTVDFTKEIDHINTGNHKRNLRNVPLSWRERDNKASSENISKVVVSDQNTAEKLQTEFTGIDTTTSEYANERLKARNSFIFKQLPHTNKSTSIDSYKQNAITDTDHANSKNYENKFTVGQLSSLVPVNVNSIEDIDFLDDATAQLLYLFESSDKLGKVKCKVCKLEIKSKVARIKKHLKKPLHQLKMQSLLDVNKIKHRSDTYFCEVCCSAIDFTKEIDHINSGYHEKKKSNAALSLRERDHKQSIATVSSTDIPTSRVKVLDHNTVAKSNMVSTEIDTKTSEYTNKSLKPKESLKFKQLMQMNKLRSIEDGEIFFCDLCVEHVATKSVIEHVQCQSHLDKLIENTNKQDNNISHYYCEACQIHIPNIYYAKDIHNGSKYHQRNLKNLKATKQVNFKEYEDPAFSNFDYMVESTNKQSSIKCKVCQHTLKSNKIKQHIGSSKHITSLSLLCTKNKLYLQYTGKYLCEFCNDNVDVEEMLNHIISEKHINSIAPKGTESKHELATSLENSNKERDIITSDRDKLASSDENYVSVYKINTVKSTSSTLNNKATEKLAALSLKNKMDSNDSSVSTNADWKEVGHKYTNKYLVEVPSKAFEVMCKICDTVVPKTEVNIHDHLKGKRHNSNYEKFICNTVKSDISKKLNVSFNKSNSDDNTKGAIAAEHAKAKTVTNKNSLFMHDSLVKLHNGILFCRCCNTEISQQDMYTHLTDWKHAVKSSAFLAENGLTVQKNKIFCNMCDIYIANINIITHIDSPSHRLKASAKTVDNTTENY